MPSWTKVHHIWLACTGVIVVFNAVFQSTILCSHPEIGPYSRSIKSRSPKSRQNFDVFGTPNFLGGGTPKFLTPFYKLHHHRSNMWKSLVTIGPETFEIRRRKKCVDVRYRSATHCNARSCRIRSTTRVRPAAKHISLGLSGQLSLPDGLNNLILRGTVAVAEFHKQVYDTIYSLQFNTYYCRPTIAD